MNKIILLFMDLIDIDTDIIKILHQIYPKFKLTKESQMFYSCFVNSFYKHLVENADDHRIDNNKNLLDMDDINSTIENLLVGGLYTHAIKEAKLAYSRYINNNNNGLTIDPLIFDKLFIINKVTIQDGVLQYITAIIEYLLAEILESSGRNCRDRYNNTTIYLDDIKKICTDDEELNNLFSKLDIFE